MRRVALPLRPLMERIENHTLKDLVIYGAGGFGKEIACLIVNHMPATFHEEYRFIGFIDDGLERDTPIKYGSVLGGSDFINTHNSPLAVVFSIAHPEILNTAKKKITKIDIEYPNIIAPNTVFYDEPSFKIGMGNVVFNGCRFSCDIHLGDFNLFNGFVALGHDVTIGDYNVFGPSSRISGNVHMGSRNFFGVNSIVLQGISMGNNIRLGASSVLMKNAMESNSLYFGNPARKIVD